MCAYTIKDSSVNKPLESLRIYTNLIYIQPYYKTNQIKVLLFCRNKRCERNKSNKN